MSTVKFKRFTKPHFLKQIGRELLGQFLNRFSSELAEKQITFTATADDDAYYEAVARAAMAPDGLPEKLIEAAYAIEGMANDEGLDRLERATGENGLAFQFRENSTGAEMALQAWLTNPELFAEKFNEQRLTRLASFDYYGSSACRTGHYENQFTPPTAETLALMTTDMEEAFRVRNRGQRACRVEVHPMDNEFWFIIRHGDTYTRVPTVTNGGQMSVLHFRPAKDDVVVYSPQRDEVRLHAGTKWEKDLYRETFGRRLMGDDFYFSERKAYDLERLRTDGPDALDVSDIPGISKVILREFELAWPGEFKDAILRKSEDIFASATKRNALAIPESGRLVRAVFDFYFGDSAKPRKVEVRLPNILKLGRYCDAALVQRLLSQNGFLVTENKPQPRGGINHVEPLAVR